MKKQIREQFISELSQSSPETLRSRLFWCDQFLDFADGDLSRWNKALVNRFLSKLEEEGYAPLTRRTAFGVVKRVFDAAKAVHEQERIKLLSSVDTRDPSAMAEVLKAVILPGPVWEMGKRAMPRAETDEINKPALSFAEISKIAHCAKGDGFEPHETAFATLASVYGLRQGEIQAVCREHIDYKGGTIFIMTEKGGERRKQRLCPEIIPYLQGYDFKWQFSPFLMNRIFKNICAKASVEDRDGLGWHSFRRYALTAVRDSLARVVEEIPFNIDHVLAAKIFFRWRLSSSSEMVDRYYTPENVLKIDEFVLEHHPVVSLWK
jgi:integrase